MTWHYRICVEQTKWGPAYTIREVYEGLGPRPGFTAEPCHPGGDTQEELIRDLEMMLADARRYPVLDITDPDNPVESR